MSWLFQPIPEVGETLSDSPTNTTTSILNIPPIGYAADDTPTLGAMQAGSMSMKWVALIEGCPYVGSDAPQAAVQSALTDVSGGDWAAATVIPMFVELRNEQSIQPLQSFIPNQGRCTLRWVDSDGSDTFGTYINRRLSGEETVLSSTADRNDTTINVASTTGFAGAGSMFIGNELISYTGTTATSFTGCTRGIYSPFGCATSGGGGQRYANHHRVGADSNYVQLRPTVTQYPRSWIGRRIGLWLHTWNEGTNTLNSHENAQLVFAGRIVGISDDPNDFSTVIECEPFLEEIRNGVIGKDIWSANLPEGIDIKTGRVFAFADWKSGSYMPANNLTVVASGASGTNQMNAGVYSLSELCEKLSAWLAGEKTAARILGSYTWNSPCTSNAGLRTKIFWRISDAGNLACGWGIVMPGEVFAFLGLGSSEPGDTGQTEGFARTGNTNSANIAEGDAVPFVNVVFHPYAPGNVGQEFSESVTYEAENEKGTFVDQRSLLPAGIRDNCPNDGNTYGLFMLDDRVLMVGSYASGTLAKCWLAPFQLASDKDTAALSYVGRRADEPERGPVTLRQVFVLEGTLNTLLSTLMYSGGASGYNHTDDTLGYGLGLGLPGELLGDPFDRSLSNLPKADFPLCVVIDEPTKFSELFAGDLNFQHSFFRWRDEHLELAKWRTPMAALAVGSFTESNKAAASGQTVNHRIASVETLTYQRPIIKIDYNRDFASSRGQTYLKSISLEDQTAVDDLGGNAKPFTISLRNTFAQLTNTGAAVEALLPDFMAFMPCVSRGFRIVERSIDLRSWEGYSVGDVFIFDDDFARDPVTGHRGINSRAGIITKIWYDTGGFNPDGSIRPMGGGIEASFLDTHRGGLYSPAADVDNTANFGGFSAGYNSVTSTLRCSPHAYTQSVTITYKQWQVTIVEDPDASYFNAGDKIVIVERDPADPASPTYWERTVSSQSGNDIVLTAALSSPAWDATKQYRIVPQKFSQVQAAQIDNAFQADDADEMIENLEPPFHPTVDNEQYDYVAPGAEPGEFVAAISYGDGRPYDAGNDRAIARTLNAFIDYTSAHQAPCLWNEYTDDTANSADWYTLWMGPVFFGTEHLSSAVTRTVTMAPWFRSSSGGNTGYIRVTLSRSPPVTGAGSDTSGSVGLVNSARFIDAFAQQEWSTTSATWQTGTDATFQLSVKDIFFGYAWVTIEKKGYGQTRGLAKLIEGARTVG